MTCGLNLTTSTITIDSSPFFSKSRLGKKGVVSFFRPLTVLSSGFIRTRSSSCIRRFSTLGTWEHFQTQVKLMHHLNTKKITNFACSIGYFGGLTWANMCNNTHKKTFIYCPLKQLQHDFTIKEYPLFLELMETLLDYY